MNIFSVIFSTCFLILGALIWVVALAIILVGAIGILRITVKQVFEVDVIEWYAQFKYQRAIHKIAKEREQNG